MATSRTQQRSQDPSPPALTVLVVDKDVPIRKALRDLLELAGYAVTLADDMSEAETLIQSKREPLLLVMGNTDTVDHAGLQHFTAVATNPVTQNAYVYLTVIPERSRLPGLVKTLTQQADPTVDLPYDLAYLLAVVATAAARVRPKRAHLDDCPDQKTCDTTPS